MPDSGVVVLGLPIPSSSPLFLSIVGIHVVAGTICVVAGIMAMLATKRPGRHQLAGSAYFWSLMVVFLSMITPSIMRWPDDNHLLVLGVLSFGAAVIGREARRREIASPSRHWNVRRLHRLTHGLLRRQRPTLACVAPPSAVGVLKSPEPGRVPFIDSGVIASPPSCQDGAWRAGRK